MTRALIAVFSLCAGLAAAQEVPSSMAIVISVADQKLVVLRDGGLWRKYPVSTSKFGIGDSYGSYKTPLGKLRVCEKIGEELASGAVIKQRHATGEVLPANSPGRDPIVTRILWLDGMEEQNHNARSRGIYIHGTTEEGKIGQPVSYGCIRMRSQDVLEVFEDAAIDTPVLIIPEKLPHFAKWVPPKPAPIIAAAPKPKPAPPTPAPALASAAPYGTKNTGPAASTPLPPIASNSPGTGKKLAANPSTLSGPVPNPSKKPATLAAAMETNPLVITRSPEEDSSGHASVTVTSVDPSTISHAMAGSILTAGLSSEPTAPSPASNVRQTSGNRALSDRSISKTAPEEIHTGQNSDHEIGPIVMTAENDAGDHSTAQSPDGGDTATKPHFAFRTTAVSARSKQ